MTDSSPDSPSGQTPATPPTTAALTPPAPGHTPGHRSVMVKLSEKGSVILVGDAAHFRENYDTNGVPTFNVSRADTLASMDRIKKLASVHRATVIIQHDARDVGKLPAFPAAAR